MYTTETDPRSLQPINHQRGHRMMPPVTRLSIIQEEEDSEFNINDMEPPWFSG